MTSGAGAPPNETVSIGNPARELSMRSNAIDGTLCEELTFQFHTTGEQLYPPVIVTFSHLIKLVT